jgi:hypothetical protein
MVHTGWTDTMVNSTEHLEQCFAKGVRDYIFRFNMLDRNIAYSLSFVKAQCGEMVSIKDLLALPFYKKMSRLKEAVLQRSLGDAFSEWFDSVDHCRRMRNRIVHGHWEILPFLEEPIRFDASVRGKGSFTVKTFMYEIGRLEAVMNDFSSLRDKHSF